MESIKEKITKLEDEIEKLPIGYISRKNINGTVRQYHQWNEDGKKKSKYIDDETASLLSEKIDRRRALQQELRTARALLPKKKRLPKEVSHKFNSEVLTGDTLKMFAKRALSYNSRPLLQKVLEYINSEASSKVLILYGLRRTGKTTIIQQAIGNLTGNEFDKAAFLQVRLGDTLATVNEDVKSLQSKGYKYIFLDEVTLMEDFIEGAALFSDIFAACGMKIILSGTDSLGFLFSEDEQLYDRCEMLHTTFIPYREFQSVLGISGIDEYIRYGGTMSLGGVHYNVNSTFSNKKSADEYVNSAIARNIQHSLKYYKDAGHFRHLQDLYDHNELTSVINRVVEDINHRFTIEILTRDFMSHDLGISARNLRSDIEAPTDVLDNIDIKAFTEGLKEALEIRNISEQNVGITDAHRAQIKEYLDLLDLTVDLEIQSLPVTDEKEYMTAISQPGLRYSQADALIRQLLLDSRFQNISAMERKRIIDRILDEIKGRMMEELVLLETKKTFSGKEVFKLKFAIGEFDMVIYDPENITCELYEIKHSKEPVPQQYRHLVDAKKCKDTEFRYGKIIRKAVIYRGENWSDGEIEYINVEDYLMGLF